VRDQHVEQLTDRGCPEEVAPIRDGARHSAGEGLANRRHLFLQLYQQRIRRRRLAAPVGRGRAGREPGFVLRGNAGPLARKLNHQLVRDCKQMSGMPAHVVPESRGDVVRLARRQSAQDVQYLPSDIRKQVESIAIRTRAGIFRGQRLEDVELSAVLQFGPIGCERDGFIERLRLHHRHAENIAFIIPDSLPRDRLPPESGKTHFLMPSRLQTIQPVPQVADVLLRLIIGNRAAAVNEQITHRRPLLSVAF